MVSENVSNHSGATEACTCWRRLSIKHTVPLIITFAFCLKNAFLFVSPTRAGCGSNWAKCALSALSSKSATTMTHFKHVPGLRS